MDYQETITVDGVSGPRGSTFVVPVSFDFLSLYTVPLTVGNVMVYNSNNLLSAALTGQRITTGATDSSAIVTYKIMFPYQVRVA